MIVSPLSRDCYHSTVQEREGAQRSAHVLLSLVLEQSFVQGKPVVIPERQAPGPTLTGITGLPDGVAVERLQGLATFRRSIYVCKVPLRRYARCKGSGLLWQVFPCCSRQYQPHAWCGWWAMPCFSLLPMPTPIPPWLQWPISLPARLRVGSP